MDKKETKEFLFDDENILEKEEVSNETNSRDKKSTYVSFESRIILLSLLVIVLLMISFILFNNGLNTKTEKEINYQETGNIDYKVYLKENNYYGEDYLTEDKQYIANLIDEIKVDFNYGLKLDKKQNYDYGYYVNAKVKVVDKDSGEKTIYEKSEVIKKRVDKSITNSDNYNISEEVSIDYEKYNQLIRSFKTEYGLSADSYLELTFYADTTVNAGYFNQDVSNRSTLKMTIPLTEQTIKINIDENEVNNKDKFVEYSNIEIINIIYLVLSAVFLIVGIYFVVKIIKLLLATRTKKSKYKVKLNKILKEYDRFIVEAKRDYDRSNSTVVDVKSFEELLDVKSNVDNPIIHIPINSGKSEFIVKHDDYIYKFVLKEADLEEKK